MNNSVSQLICNAVHAEFVSYTYGCPFLSRVMFRVVRGKVGIMSDVNPRLVQTTNEMCHMHVMEFHVTGGTHKVNIDV